MYADIIIDINQLLQQKGIRNREEEYRAVLIHGLLHLVGYDHIHSADAEKMKKILLGVALSVLFIPIREESFRHAAMNLSFGKQKKSLNF